MDLFKKNKKKESSKGFMDTLKAVEESSVEESKPEKSTGNFYESELDKLFHAKSEDSMYSDNSAYDDEPKEKIKVKYKKWEYVVLVIEVILIIYTLLVFTGIAGF